METPVEAVEEFCGTEIRIIEIDGSPWVLSQDIGNALGYSQAQTVNELVSKENAQYRHVGSFNQFVINTDGLESISRRSRKKYADTLPAWIDERVLPALENAQSSMPRAQGDGQPPSLQDDEPEETPEPEEPAIHQNGEAEEPTALTRTFEDHEIRIVQKDGEPWLVATDVAKALGYRGSANLTRILDDDEKGYSKVSTPGGPQRMAVINESGVYHATFKSQKKNAKTFRRWTTGEVLPSIQRSGGYQLNGHPQHSAPDALRMVADQMEEQQAQILDLNERLIEVKGELEEQRTLVEQNSNNGYTLRSGPALRKDFNRIVKSYATSAGISDRQGYKRVYRRITHNGMTVNDAARMRGISKVEMLDRDGQLKEAIKVVENMLDEL